MSMRMRIQVCASTVWIKCKPFCVTVDAQGFSTFFYPSATQPLFASLPAQVLRGLASFRYQDVFEQPNKQPIKFRKVSGDFVSTTTVNGKEILQVQPEGLTLLAREAMVDIAHLLRPGHLQQLRNILDDPEASANDKFVALELLKNANIAAAKVLPGCQDTGTAIVMGKRGQYVWTDGKDEEHLSQGVGKAYTETNLRYSQVAPQDMFTEKNTGSNLPAQIELYAAPGNQYEMLFIAKGGGSANKTMLYQQTKALLNPKSLEAFLDEKVKSLGTAACPPYHLAVVIGGLSAEQNLKTVKLASCRYLDGLANSGNADGRAFRDLEWEEKVLNMTRKMGIGAQFGGKYFCHDVRVIRMPRHGASCPVGIGVSCSADRQAIGKITSEGLFLEELERHPDKYLPEVTEDKLSAEVVKVSPMDQIRQQLSECPIRTRLSLTGTLIVARDIAHAKLQERPASGPGLPQNIKDCIIICADACLLACLPACLLACLAGLRCTQECLALGSGRPAPTRQGFYFCRMDSYVDPFMAAGGSMVTLAKGNRSRAVTNACKKYGGFYLGSIGGPAAILAQDCIKKVEVLEYPELGMEAIWKIDVENFPAFVVVDNKGNDFFAKWQV
ncbi:fumarate hydratase [Dunaliella salina]|uniref:fumarate hydratase n=1 Tax=Dunaliella salina TaxID=3046 RepID=A0ABQ7H370_DUNSA|nr:fumarate hydratase [Dunaliella salina]|eukprot:KAF5841314.1 fumarate hydratase [Dunaliella salina]